MDFPCLPHVDGIAVFIIQQNCAFIHVSSPPLYFGVVRACQINNHFKEKRILKYKSLLTDDKNAMLFDVRAYVIPLKTSIKAQSTLHIQIEISLIILF